jgi:hypothetical protein
VEEEVSPPAIPARLSVIRARLSLIPARPSVIPARLPVIPARLSVIPAKAGIQRRRHQAETPGWTPAFAGVTMEG